MSAPPATPAQAFTSTNGKPAKNVSPSLSWLRGTLSNGGLHARTREKDASGTGRMAHGNSQSRTQSMSRRRRKNTSHGLSSERNKCRNGAGTPAFSRQIYVDRLVETPSSSSSLSSESPGSGDFSRQISVPRSIYREKPPLSLKQRKALLADRFEHRVSNEHISSKWKGYWMFMTVTVVLSIIYRIMDAITLMNMVKKPGVPDYLYTIYHVFTWLIPALPLWHLVISTVWKVPFEKFTRIKVFAVPVQNNNVEKQGIPSRHNFINVSLERLLTGVVLLLFLPIWMLIGETMFALKLFALGKVAEKWWSTLHIFGIPRDSKTTTNAHLRSNKLKVEDICLQAGNTPMVSMARIQKSANQRRKRIAALTPEKSNSRKDHIATTSQSAQHHAKNYSSDKNALIIVGHCRQEDSLFYSSIRLLRKLFILEMPRFDLSVDAATLNRMVMLELVLKYIPQWSIQSCIAVLTHLHENGGSDGATAHFFGQGWDYASIFSACASFASLAYSSHNMIHMWREKSWASTLPDLEEAWSSFAKSCLSPQRIFCKNIKTNPKCSGSKSSSGQDATKHELQEEPLNTPGVASLQHRENLRKIILSSNFRRALSPLSTNHKSPSSGANAPANKRGASSRPKKEIRLSRRLAIEAVKSANKMRQRNSARSDTCGR